MKLNIDPEWLKRAGEEDECGFLSIGVLPIDVAREDYFLDPMHSTWRTRYYEGVHGGNILAFTEAWAEEFLPKEHNWDDMLTVTLLDSWDGKLYETQMPAYFCNRGEPDVLDADYENPKAVSLQSYLYAGHHCACHRKCAAKGAGAVTDEECEGERFKIAQITYHKLPGVVLFSETLTVEELETSLRQGIEA